MAPLQVFHFCTLPYAVWEITAQAMTRSKDTYPLTDSFCDYLNSADCLLPEKKLSDFPLAVREGCSVLSNSIDLFNRQLKTQWKLEKAVRL